MANHPGDKLVALTYCMNIRITCPTAWGGKMCGTLDDITVQLSQVSISVS